MGKILLAKCGCPAFIRFQFDFCVFYGLANDAVTRRYKNQKRLHFTKSCVPNSFSIGIKYEKGLLCVTDAATGVLSAMCSLSTIFPRMLRVTCLTHGLNRLAEFVCGRLSNANNLVSNVKSVSVR